MALTRRFNALSGWVCTVICATEKPKDRVRVMRKVLVIADKLKQARLSSLCADGADPRDRSATSTR